MRWLRGLWLALLPGLLPAQEHMRFSLRPDDTELCNVEVEPVAAGSIGTGWLRIDIDNLDERVHRVEVGYRGSSRQGGEVSARRTFEVPPGSHARGFLPLTRCVAAAQIVSCDIDGRRVGDSYFSVTGGDPGFLVVAEQDIATLRNLCDLLGRSQAPRSGRVPSSLTVDVEPAVLPPDWPLLSGFDVIVLDGRARVGAEVQETLRRYAAAGGTLVIGYGDRLPAGPLANLSPESGRCGLGRIVRLEGLSATAENVGELRRQIDALSRSGPVPSGWYARMQIPGLGEIPGRLFLLVILLFAVLVGPVNLWWLRQRRRPMLALITVPALGFGCTICILCYGLLHDGLGLRGVQRSFTVLDQQQHEAAAVVTRTLFAGLSPGPLQVPASSFVDTPDNAQRSVVFDADRATLAGTILPSRQPTALVSAQHGVVRARLRFRKAAGGLQALTDGTLQPPQQWLLRDLAGDYFVGTGTALQAVGAAAARQRLEAAGEALAIAATETDSDPYGSGGFLGSYSMVAIRDLSPAAEDFLRQQLPDGDLPRGSYLLLTDTAPWIDEFGLQVDWMRSEHWVLGRLGPEDFLP